MSAAAEPPLARRLLFWVVVGMLVVSLLIDATVFTDAVEMPEAALAAWLTVVVQGVLALALLGLADPLRRQRAVLAVLAVLWGGIVAANVAAHANTALGSLLTKAGLASIEAAITAPLNEETFKLLGVLAVLVLSVPSRLTAMDGFVYGFLVGTGFDLIENVSYAYQAALEVEGGDAQFAAALASSVDRLVQGFALHAFWTSMTGAGLAAALAAGRGSRWRGWLLAAGLFLAALVLHSLWDLPALSASTASQDAFVVILTLVVVLATAAVWRWSLGGERRLVVADSRMLGVAPPASVWSLWRPEVGGRTRAVERAVRTGTGIEAGIG
ncbi:PrsW family intramembrane metalloprotease [Herbiconiux moechotypicola]|uniref:PrsW family intramembrane metalloprotease n=1 Tax=Herbiconiux moechotypicola TaxID=637393 RepID=A0ABP5QYM6_9MICO|nr:PrsW family intramembrane metalloprotease [Herbiconiux moechotypicola]MCS5731569.1 PrsW family intramembrane metalloprotease [Herbiconiux moechotypicola]